MITEIKNLKKVVDVLNSEGTILGLYKLNDEWYLASHLQGVDGNVYYTVQRDRFYDYLNGELTLRELYLESEDLIVTMKRREGNVSCPKEDLAGNINCGDSYYPTLSSGLKNMDIGSILAKE